MSNITLFADASMILHDFKQGLPDYLADPEERARLAAYNDVIQTGPNYPTLSIKGKVFTLHKDGAATRLMRSEDEVLQNIQVTVVGANPNARVYYAAEYVEGAEGEAARPDCYSNDGQTPAADARNPQCNKCQICPHAAWGTGNNGNGTACTVNTRLAVVAPEHLTNGKAEPTLLRVPAGSRRNFADFVNVTKRHGTPFFAAVVKIGFDPTAPAPKLTFKPCGYLGSDAFAEARKLVDDPTVQEIIGTSGGTASAAPAQPAPVAAPVASPAVAAPAPVASPAVAAPAPVARPAPAPAPAPVAQPAPVEVIDEDGVIEMPPPPPPAPAAPDPAPKVRAAKPKPAPAPAPAAPVAEGGGLLDDLDALLSQPDD